MSAGFIRQTKGMEKPSKQDENVKKAEHRKAEEISKNVTEKMARAGDFIGRLVTLIVMLVTSVNTAAIMVTSFIEEVYWKGGVHAALLLFIHLPVISTIIWLMCKSRVQKLYHKVGPETTNRGEELDLVEDVMKKKIGRK